jgi:hypothetical protein
VGDNLLLDLTPRQVEIVRQALRLQEEAHKRNGFKVLEIEAQELRSHISNAVIDNQRNLTRA